MRGDFAPARLILPMQECFLSLHGWFCRCSQADFLPAWLILFLQGWFCPCNADFLFNPARLILSLQGWFCPCKANFVQARLICPCKADLCLQGWFCPCKADFVHARLTGPCKADFVYAKLSSIFAAATVVKLSLQSARWWVQAHVL